MRTVKKKKVNIILDGRELIVSVAQDDESILDAALRAGADLPYACKGGVCATCRCKVLSGEVDMFLNYSLEEDEVEKGYAELSNLTERPKCSLEF